MGRPVLGIICCNRTIGQEAAQSVAYRYIAAATTYADAAALLVPSLPERMAASDVVPRLDGLLLTGSPSNVDPACYDEDGAADAEGPYDAGRDTMMRQLVDACITLGKPVFGICRGLQELNVAFGGTLRRDASRSPDLLRHHAPADAEWDDMFQHGHDVSLAPNGMLRRAFGVERMWVNSVHFQGIARLGDGLQPEAVASDGMVEAFSGRINGAPVLAVQWHPEWRTEDNLRSRQFFHLLGRALRDEPVERN